MSSLGFKPNKSLIWEIRTGFGLSASKGSRTILAVSKHRAQTGVPQLSRKLISSSQWAKFSSCRIPQRASTQFLCSVQNRSDFMTSLILTFGPRGHLVGYHQQFTKATHWRPSSFETASPVGANRCSPPGSLNTRETFQQDDEEASTVHLSQQTNFQPPGWFSFFSWAHLALVRFSSFFPSLSEGVSDY